MPNHSLSIKTFGRIEILTCGCEGSVARNVRLYNPTTSTKWLKMERMFFISPIGLDRCIASWLLRFKVEMLWSYPEMTRCAIANVPWFGLLSHRLACCWWWSCCSLALLVQGLVRAWQQSLQVWQLSSHHQQEQLVVCDECFAFAVSFDCRWWNQEVDRDEKTSLNVSEVIDRGILSEFSRRDDTRRVVIGLVNDCEVFGSKWDETDRKELLRSREKVGRFEGQNSSMMVEDDWCRDDERKRQKSRGDEAVWYEESDVCRQKIWQVHGRLRKKKAQSQTQANDKVTWTRFTRSGDMRCAWAFTFIFQVGFNSHEKPSPIEIYLCSCATTFLTVSSPAWIQYIIPQIPDHLADLRNLWSINKFTITTPGYATCKRIVSNVPSPGNTSLAFECF